VKAPIFDGKRAGKVAMQPRVETDPISPLPPPIKGGVRGAGALVSLKGSSSTRGNRVFSA